MRGCAVASCKGTCLSVITLPLLFGLRRSNRRLRVLHRLRAVLLSPKTQREFIRQKVGIVMTDTGFKAGISELQWEEPV
jgi:hypothetical protein